MSPILLPFHGFADGDSERKRGSGWTGRSSPRRASAVNRRHRHAGIAAWNSETVGSSSTIQTSRRTVLVARVTLGGKHDAAETCRIINSDLNRALLAMASKTRRDPLEQPRTLSFRIANAVIQYCDFIVSINPMKECPERKILAPPKQSRPDNLFNRHGRVIVSRSVGNRAMPRGFGPYRFHRYVVHPAQQDHTRFASENRSKRCFAARHASYQMSDVSAAPS